MTNLNSSFSYKGLALVQTCEACPEQYDCYNGRGQKVGYFRLRHGTFRVNHPDVGGDTIFKKDFDEAFKGCFSDQEEREKFLTKGLKALRKHIRADGRE